MRSDGSFSSIFQSKCPLGATPHIVQINEIAQDLSGQTGLIGLSFLKGQSQNELVRCLHLLSEYSCFIQCFKLYIEILLYSDIFRFD